MCGLTRQEDVDAAVEAGADLVGFILADESPRRAEALLDAPDTVLRVAVFVGEREETDADLVQFYGRENGHRSRDAELLRGDERVGTVVDLPWREDDPSHLDRARATAGRVMLAGGLGAGQRRRGDRRGAARGRSTPRARRSRRRASRTTTWTAEWVEAATMTATRTFGDYGGRYVPETLIPALDELEAAWESLRDDAGVPRGAARAAHELRGPADAAHARRALRAGPARCT